MMSSDKNPLMDLSDAMTEAVTKAGAATLLVDGRRRMPASGIAYSEDLILTADHVVEREDEIRILLPNGNEVSANLAGRDPGSDLALLRTKGGLAAALPASQEGRVGQIVLALGRPSPEGIEASLGVVSALGGPTRTGRGGLLERYLRTDTTPYPGFSGGPLIDASGQILGVNTSGLWHGASLTIPVALAWRIAATLAEHGHIRRGFLGIRSQPVEISATQRQLLKRDQTAGLLLISVDAGGPADRGGLLVGDILVALAGQPVSDPDQLLAMLHGSLVGKPTPVEVLRGGQPMTVTVSIGERK